MSQKIDKALMYSYYLEDPKIQSIERKLDQIKVQYFYFDKSLEISTKSHEVLNGCLLEGATKLIYERESYDFTQFDFFFLPPEKKLRIKINTDSHKENKICLVYSEIKKKRKVEFEFKHFDLNNFISRGELSSSDRIATYRTVWTAIKNGYYMSGFTNIPNKALKQGVLTSVNLVENKSGELEIYPHIHPGFPEVYIYCISNEKVAITQYLINENGFSICRDLRDGDGLFFPGNYGHVNFAKPVYKELEFCMYMWIIPTLGLKDNIKPITLRI